jgi:uncharacterized protein (DUF1697 family)
MAARRYAAFLRGVMPTNAKMPELKRCFEAIGFTDVKTVLASGNVVFTARAEAEAALQRKIEDGMDQHLGRRFLTIVRSLDTLRAIVDADPYADFKLAPNAKRIVTFLREAPASKLRLPIEHDGARLLCAKDGDVFGAYVPSPRGPVFMTLIGKQLGEGTTTRTWDTVKKVLGPPPDAALTAEKPPRAAKAAAKPRTRPARPRRYPRAIAARGGRAGKRP